jgi:hypothetical protein
MTSKSASPTFEANKPSITLAVSNTAVADGYAPLS